MTTMDTANPLAQFSDDDLRFAVDVRRRVKAGDVAGLSDDDLRRAVSIRQAVKGTSAFSPAQTGIDPGDTLRGVYGGGGSMGAGPSSLEKLPIMQQGLEPAIDAIPGDLLLGGESMRAGAARDRAARIERDRIQQTITPLDQPLPSQNAINRQMAQEEYNAANPRGPVEDFIRSAGRGAAGVVTAPVDLLMDPLRRTFQPEEAQREFDRSRAARDIATAPQTLAGQVGSGVGQVLASVPTGGAVGVGRTAALLAAGGAQGGYQDYINTVGPQDASTIKALVAGGGYGVAEFVGERFGLGAILKAGNAAGFKQALSGILTASGVNATEEMLTQIAQNAIAKSYDPSRPLTEGAGTAGLVGGIAGGVGGGVAMANSAAARGEQLTQRRDVRQAQQDARMGPGGTPTQQGAYQPRPVNPWEQNQPAGADRLTPGKAGQGQPDAATTAADAPPARPTPDGSERDPAGNVRLDGQVSASDGQTGGEVDLYPRARVILDEIGVPDAGEVADRLDITLAEADRLVGRWEAEGASTAPAPPSLATPEGQPQSLRRTPGEETASPEQASQAPVPRPGVGSEKSPSPNSTRPALGSSRLGIPLEAVSETQRQRDAAAENIARQSRPFAPPGRAAEAERRAVMNRVRNPDTAGYSTEGSLTPEGVFSREDTRPVDSGVAPKDAPDDYRMAHRPNKDGPRGHDLNENDLAPDDIYQHPEYYVGEPGSKSARESIAAMRKIRANPDAEVTIYRSAPEGTTMREGDWVSLSKTYAKQHGMGDSEADDMPVIALKVRARDIRWAGDALEEWGYYPDPSSPSSAAAVVKRPDGAPKVRRPPIAALMDDGTVLLDSDAQLHAQLADRGDFPHDRIVDWGFVVDGKYKPEGAASRAQHGEDARKGKLPKAGRIVDIAGRTSVSESLASPSSAAARSTAGGVEVAPASAQPRSAPSTAAPARGTKSRPQGASSPTAESAPASRSSPEGTREAKQPWEMTAKEYVASPDRVEFRGQEEKVSKGEALQRVREITASLERAKASGKPRQIAAAERSLAAAEKVAEDALAGRFNEYSIGLAMNDSARRAHRSFVKQAVEEGRPVPAEVLKDYPELKGKGEATPKVASATPDVAETQNSPMVDTKHAKTRLVRIGFDLEGKMGQKRGVAVDGLYSEARAHLKDLSNQGQLEQSDLNAVRGYMDRAEISRTLGVPVYGTSANPSLVRRMSDQEYLAAASTATPGEVKRTSIYKSYRRAGQSDSQALQTTFGILLSEAKNQPKEPAAKVEPPKSTLSKLADRLSTAAEEPAPSRPAFKGTIQFGEPRHGATSGITGASKVVTAFHLDEAGEHTGNRLEIVKPKYGNDWVLYRRGKDEMMSFGSQKIAKPKFDELGKADNLRDAKQAAEAVLRGEIDPATPRHDRLRPLEEFTPAPSRAWSGTTKVQGESPYETDGRAMFRRDAVAPSITAKLKQSEYGSVMGPEMLEDTWASSVKAAKTEGKEARVLGVVRDIGSDVAYLDLGGKAMAADANRLKFLQTVTKADRLVGTTPKRPIVMFKGEKPVAVLMPRNMPDDFDLSRAKGEPAAPKSTLSKLADKLSTAADKLKLKSDADIRKGGKGYKGKGGRAGASLTPDELARIVGHAALKAASAIVRAGDKIVVTAEHAIASLKAFGVTPDPETIRTVRREGTRMLVAAKNKDGTISEHKLELARAEQRRSTSADVREGMAKRGAEAKGKTKLSEQAEAHREEMTAKREAFADKLDELRAQRAVGKDIRREIVRLAKENLEPADRFRIMDFLAGADFKNPTAKNADVTRDILAGVTRILHIADTAAERRSKAELRAIVGKASKPSTGPRLAAEVNADLGVKGEKSKLARGTVNARDVAKLRTPVRDALTEVVDSLRNDHTTGTGKLADFLERQGTADADMSVGVSDYFSTEELARIKALDNKLSDDLTPEERTLLGNAIKHAAHLSAEGDRFQVGSERRAFGEVKDKIIEEVNARGKVASNPQRAIDGGVGKLLQSAKELVTTDQMDLSRMLGTVAGTDSTLHDAAYKDLAEGESAQKLLAREAIEMSGLHEWSAADLARVHQERTVKLSSGVQKLRGWELMEILGHYMDPSTQHEIEQAPFIRDADKGKHKDRGIFATREDLATIEAMLTPKERASVKKLHDALKHVYREANDAHEDLLGFRLPDQEFHWSRERDRGQTNEGLDAKVARSTRFEDSRMYKERTGSKEPIVLRNPFEWVPDAIHQHAGMAKLARPMRNVRRLLNDSDVRSALTTAGGDNFIRKLEGRIAELVPAPGVVDGTALTQTLQGLLGRYASAKLAFRLSTIAKQRLGLFQAASVAEDAGLVARLNAEALNPVPILPGQAKALRAEIDPRSGYLAERADPAFSATLQSAANPRLRVGTTRAGQMWNAAERFGLSGLRAADAGVVLRTYRAVKAHLEGQGFTGDELIDRSVTLTERIIRDSQNPTSPLDMSGLNLSGRKNPYLGAALLFTSASNKMRNVLVQSISDARADPSGKNLGKLAKVAALTGANAVAEHYIGIATSGVAIGAIVGAAVGGDDERKKVGMLAKVLANLADVVQPGAGDAIRTFQNPDASGTAIGKAITAARSVAKAADDEKMRGSDFAVRVINAARALLPIVPDAPLDYAQNIIRGIAGSEMTNQPSGIRAAIARGDTERVKARIEKYITAKLKKPAKEFTEPKHPADHEQEIRDDLRSRLLKMSGTKFDKITVEQMQNVERLAGRGFANLTADEAKDFVKLFGVPVSRAEEWYADERAKWDEWAVKVGKLMPQ